MTGLVRPPHSIPPASPAAGPAGNFDPSCRDAPVADAPDRLDNYDLAPAEGVAISLLLGVLLWCGVSLLAWWLFAT